MKLSFFIAIFLSSLQTLSFRAFAADEDSLIFQSNRMLARTINIGYVIETGSPHLVADSMNKQLEEIKKSGFTAVRLPINWVPSMDSANHWSIQPSFIHFIDQIVTNALDSGLTIILDNQSDEALMNDPVRYENRIIALWKQLSDHFKSFPNTLMFELMAEPHGQLDAHWNDLTAELLKIVRATNPQRPVIIGPSGSNRPGFLYQLRLPADDRYIIVSFHQYTPVRFTMQGETWFPFGKPLEWLGTTWPGQQDEASLGQLFSLVDDWAKKNQRPVFMGEFGVSSMADTASAYRWIRFNRGEAEKRGFTWGYWSCFGIEFSLFDAKTKSWNTRFLEALMKQE